MKLLTSEEEEVFLSMFKFLDALAKDLIKSNLDAEKHYL